MRILFTFVGETALASTVPEAAEGLAGVPFCCMKVAKLSGKNRVRLDFSANVTDLRKIIYACADKKKRKFCYNE